MQQRTSTLLLAGTTLLLVCAGLLAGCGSSGSSDAVDDPTPTVSAKQQYEKSRFAVVTAEQPLDIDGCQVRVHEIFVTRPGNSWNSSFTLATATCPSARATTTHENCGKNCVHDTVRVEPLANVDADPVSVDQKARLKTKMDALQKELNQLSRELNSNP